MTYWGHIWKVMGVDGLQVTANEKVSMFFYTHTWTKVRPGLHKHSPVGCTAILHMSYHWSKAEEHNPKCPQMRQNFLLNTYQQCPQQPPAFGQNKTVKEKNSTCVCISQGVCLDPDDWQVALVANLSLLEKRLVKEALTSSEALVHVCVFKGESVCVYVNNTKEGAQLCVYSPGVRLSSLAHKPFRTD